MRVTYYYQSVAYYYQSVAYYYQSVTYYYQRVTAMHTSRERIANSMSCRAL